MIYQDKSKEEILAALEQFIDGYSKKIGQVNLSELKEWAKKKYDEKVELQRESSFGTLTPKSLETLIQVIDEQLKPMSYDQFMKLNENDSQQGNAPIDEFLVQTKPKGKKAKK